MDRRKFCRSTLAASAALSYPLLQPPSSRGLPALVSRPLRLDGKQIDFERRAVDDLGRRFSGRLLLSDNADYDENCAQSGTECTTSGPR